MNQNYIIMGFSLILISVIMAILLIIFYISFIKKSILYDDQNQAVAVVDIIELLRRVCPISLEKKWKLLSLNSGPIRCWSRHLSFPVLNANIQLYASSMAMNCSALQLLHLIADISKWGEWEPSDALSSFHAKTLVEDQLKKDSFMRADKIVCLINETTLKTSPTMFRFLYLTKDDVGCVLLWNTRKLEFKFFLVQRCTSVNSDSECCLVTHIAGTHEFRKDLNTAALVIQRLRNMNDAIRISSLNATIFNFLSVSPFVCKEPVDSSIVEEKQVPKIFKLSPTTTYLTKNEIPQVFVLTPFSYDSKCTIGNLRGFHITVQKLENASIFLKKINKKISAPKSTAVSKNIILKDINHKPAVISPQKRRLAQSQFYAPLSTTQSTESSSELKILNTEIKEDKSGSFLEKDQLRTTLNSSPSKNKTSEDFTSRKNTDSPIGKPRDVSEATLSTCYGSNEDESFEEKKSSDEDNSCFHYNDQVCVSDEDLLKVNEMAAAPELCEFELLLPDSRLSDVKIADFVTQGNYCASQLQAELLQVSGINLQSSIEDQKLCSGGWMYHSTYKGINVFTKVLSSGYLKTISYMCATAISVPCKDVWKLVINPRTRFICDETVKKVRILDHLSNGQKIIHTYHEASGLLKKEAVDFCLLHTEREEKDRFYVSFHSVEYENCPLMDSVIRGILLPSGWVVQEMDGSKICKVTYLLQILVNSPDSMLIQELSVIVPASLYNLTNFLIQKPL